MKVFHLVLVAIFLEIITEKRIDGEGGQDGERSGKKTAHKRDNETEAINPPIE